MGCEPLSKVDKCFATGLHLVVNKIHMIDLAELMNLKHPDNKCLGGVANNRNIEGKNFIGVGVSDCCHNNIECIIGFVNDII